MKPETRAIHLPHRRSDGAVAPPIHLSTTFEHGPAAERLHDHEYRRESNPNVGDLEIRLASLEGGIGAVAYGSGMAAGAALFRAMPPGAVVVFHQDLYFAFRKLAEVEFPARGMAARFADFRDHDSLKAAFEGATLVWFETPSNPRLEVIDIEAVAAAAHEAGAQVAVDGTFATPALQSPFKHGADFVMHSLTKFIGGHSDVMGGALIVRDNQAILEDLHKHRSLSGAVLGPFDAWLAARGLQSLYCRMAQHAANAKAIAEMLDGHPAIARVNYPFLEGSDAGEVANKQMSAGGGILSIELAGGRDAALSVARALRLFVNATSVGGVESLVEHRASVEGAWSQTPQSLLRLSVGLEHVDDLKADLRDALSVL